MEQTNINPSPEFYPGNKKKNILLWLLVIFAALAVIFFSASYVKKFVEKGKLEEKITENKAVKSEEKTAISQETPVDATPLEVKILQASFNESSRQLNVEVSVENTSDLFADNLVYNLELHKGDALAPEGYLFEPLEFTVATSGKVEKFFPKESRIIQINYIPPASLESGNYFLRVGVNDKNAQIFGSNYTKQPVQLTGQGGFLGFLRGSLRNSYGNNGLEEGYATKKDETASLVFYLRDNEKLAKVIAEKNIFWQAKIYSLNFNEKLVKEIQKEKVALLTEDDGLQFIKLDLNPSWEGIKAGPYKVVFALLDEENKLLTDEFPARWVIDGLFARISEITSDKNLYLRGEALDFKVAVVSSMDESSQKGVLEVQVVAQELETPLVLKKEFNLDDVELDFSDQKAPQRLTLKTLQAYLKDATTGEILDEYQVEFQKYSPQNWREFLAYHRDVIFVSALVVFVLIFFWLWFLSRRGNIGKAGLLVGLILMIIVLFVFYQFLFAQETNADLAKSGSRIYYSSAPSGNLGTCPQRGYYEFTVKVFCEDCMNGTNGYLRIYKNGDRYNQRSFADTYDYYCSVAPDSGICLFGIRDAMYTHYFNGSAYGHDRPEHRESGSIGGVHLYHVIDEGPFGYNVDANGSFKSEIQYSRSNYCEPNSYTGPTYSISCTNVPRVDGVCAATHYNCSSGNLGYTAEYADRWEWWCNGSGGGSNVLCREMKPPAVCSFTFSANPNTVAYNGVSTLSWTSTNAIACGAGGSWSGWKNPNGSESTGPLTTPRTYSLECWNAAWVSCGVKSVTVIPAPILTFTGTSGTQIRQPIINLPYGGGNVTLEWTPTNATWCWGELWFTPIGIGWKSSANGTYTEPTGNLTSPQKYTLRCGNAGSTTVERSVQVNVASPICGNGAREGSEQCDLGADNGACPKTCSATCTSNSCCVPSCTGLLNNPCSTSCGGGSRVIKRCTDDCATWQDVTEACNSHPCPPGYREVTPW